MVPLLFRGRRSDRSSTPGLRWHLMEGTETTNMSSRGPGGAQLADGDLTSTAQH